MGISRWSLKRIKKLFRKKRIRVTHKDGKKKTRKELLRTYYARKWLKKTKKRKVKWGVPAGYFCTNCCDCKCRGSGLNCLSCWGNDNSRKTCCKGAPYTVCGKKCPRGTTSGPGIGPWKKCRKKKKK